MAARKMPGRGFARPTAHMACSSPAYSTGTSCLRHQSHINPAGVHRDVVHYTSPGNVRAGGNLRLWSPCRSIPDLSYVTVLMRANTQWQQPPEPI